MFIGVERGLGKGERREEGVCPSEEAGQRGLTRAPALMDVQAPRHRGDGGHGGVGQVRQGGRGA